MYGSTIGSLNIYEQSMRGGALSMVWTLSGNRGNYWRQDQVTVFASFSRVPTRVCSRSSFVITKYSVQG